MEAGKQAAAAVGNNDQVGYHSGGPVVTDGKQLENGGGGR